MQKRNLIRCQVCGQTDIICSICTNRYCGWIQVDFTELCEFDVKAVRIKIKELKLRLSMNIGYDQDNPSGMTSEAGQNNVFGIGIEHI